MDFWHLSTEIIDHCHIQSIISGEIANFFSSSWVLPTSARISRFENFSKTLNLAFFINIWQINVCLQKHAGQRRFGSKQSAYERDQIDQPKTYLIVKKSAKYKEGIFRKSQTSIFS